VLEDLSSAPWWSVAAAVSEIVFLVAVALHDLRSRRIPNAAVYPAILVALAFALVRPDGPWWSFVGAGLLAGSVFAIVSVASRGGMGMGDAKLATFIGLMAGWPGIAVAAFVACAAGAVAGLLLMATGRIGRREPSPFAPALAVGAFAAAVAGRPLARLLWPGIV
jgi:prepilin signal peptidase PulO-like enzyme (type II secretory pathway)